MQVTIYNTAKHRLETIDVDYTVKNTTWFDDIIGSDTIYKLTDFKGGLLIEKRNYGYAIWIDSVTRLDIDRSYQQAQDLLVTYEYE
jgi:hypothetical protein